MAKKTAEQILNSGATPEAIDSLIGSADATVKMDGVLKAAPVPNVQANIQSLVDEVNKRGGVPMTVVAGTEIVRNVNAMDKTVNTGGEANHSNQVQLKMNSVKMNLGV